MLVSAGVESLRTDRVAVLEFPRNGTGTGNNTALPILNFQLNTTARGISHTNMVYQNATQDKDFGHVSRSRVYVGLKIENEPRLVL